MNPLLDSRPAHLGGMQIHVSSLLTERKMVARSPSRALRRWRRGIRKVSPYADVPMRGAIRAGGTLFMHPATYDALRGQLAVENAERLARTERKEPPPPESPEAAFMNRLHAHIAEVSMVPPGYMPSWPL